MRYELARLYQEHCKLKKLAKDYPDVQENLKQREIVFAEVLSVAGLTPLEAEFLEI